MTRKKFISISLAMAVILTAITVAFGANPWGTICYYIGLIMGVIVAKDLQA